ncbi:hypothetical protein JR338_10995 [Chloroflexota bacterium]|nr:hypothetical protein JR338_10995 [Chloroflexota bacterium]
MGLKQSRKIIILLLGILLLASQVGCSGQKLDFQVSEHPANDLIPNAFTNHTVSTAQFDLHIQDSIFETEMGQELYDLILADYTALSTLLQADKHLDIYVMDEPLVDDILLDGTSIYCSIKDVKKGYYQTALVNAYTGFSLPWKLAGVEGAVFGNEIEVDELQEYYSDEANYKTLSLFPSFFFGVYTDHNTLETARDTAASLVNFIVAEQGPDALYQTISQTDYRQAWLESIGVNGTYEPVYDLGFLEEMAFSSSEDYTMIFTSANRTYSFSENFTDSPTPMMYLLSNFNTGMENMMAYIKDAAPGYFAQIEPTWEAPIYYYFDGDLRRSYSEPSKASLYFPSYSLSNLIYETTLYLFPEPKSETQVWKSVGLAEYMFTMADVPDLGLYNYFSLSADDLTGNDALFLTALQEYYLSKSDYPETLNDIDNGLVYEGMAMVALSNPLLDIEYPRMATWPIAAFTNQENKYLAYPGNSLTYPEAYLFTKYLVDIFGLESMLDYCSYSSATAFENTFGLSFYDAFADFRAAYSIDN